MKTATSSLLPRVSAAASASKEQPAVSAKASSEHFPIAPGPSKRRSRRRAAVIGLTGHDLQRQDTEKPSLAQIVQRSRPSPQTQEPSVVVRKLLTKKRQRLDEAPLSTKVPSDLGSPSAGFVVNASPRSKILHTYSRKVADARRGLIAEDDSGLAPVQVEEALNIEEAVVLRKLTRINGKRKRRAPVGELALVRSAAETETSLSQSEASCIHMPRDTFLSP